MSTTVSSLPLEESQAALRIKRISRLAFIVFSLMRERWQGGISTEFNEVESQGLIEALRVCSSYVEHIGCINVDDLYDLKIEGLDGFTYIIRFSVFGPEISIHAARIRLTKLAMPSDQESGPLMTMEVMDVLEDHSERSKLGKVTTDQAFLIGMSMIIGFMDHPNEDERLQSLIRMITPSREELREIRGKLSPSSTNYDQEVDQPF